MTGVNQPTRNVQFVVAALIRRDGLVRTARAVRSRLDDDTALGYSAAGVVEEVGEAVAGVRAGQLVATAGAGQANHAEFQAVPGLRVELIPGVGHSPNVEAPERLAALVEELAAAASAPAG